MLRDLEANRPWQKLQRNLLLLLQLLAAIFIIIALLKPAIPTSGAIAEHTIIVIDTSLSMQAKENGRTRLEIAKEQVAEIINNLGSNQTITLIEAGSSPSIITSNSKDQGELISELEEIKGWVGSVDEIAAYSLAKSIAIAETNSGIMWFSDGANNKINGLQDFIPEEIAFKHIQVGNNVDNLSIAAFSTQDFGNGINGLVRVDNLGLVAKPARLTIYNYDKQVIDSFNFNVQGNSSYSVELEQLPSSPAFQAVLEVEDSLQEDNLLWSVPYINEGIRISLVSASGNHFLEKALQAGSNIQLEKMLKDTRFNENIGDVIVLDQYVPEVLPPANVLLIAPSNSSSWFSFTGEDTTESQLEVISTNHPLLNHVDLEPVHIAKLKTFSKITGLESLVKAGKKDVLVAGEIEGRRVVILAFNINQSDLPLRPTFPILMQNIISWLTEEQQVFISSGNPGESLDIPLTIGATNLEIITPTGEKLKMSSNQIVSSEVIPEELGLYQVNEYKNNQQLTRYFTVQFSEKEVNIQPEAINVNSAATVNEDENNGLSEKSIGLQILAFLFALIALIFVFIEWVVYSRGY